DDPDRLAAPLEDQALALGQRADVRRHRRTGELGTLAGEPALDEWHRSHADADGADHCRGGCQEAPPAVVDRAPLDRIHNPFIAHPPLRESSGRWFVSLPRARTGIPDLAKDAEV